LKIGLKVLLEATANKTMNHASRLLLLPFTALVLLMLPMTAQALEHWYIPTEAEIKTLIVSNPTSSQQLLWIAKPNDGTSAGSTETSFAIAAGQKLEFPLIDSRVVNFLHVKAQSKKLIASVIDQTGRSIAWPKGSSAAYQDFQFSESTAVIINLTPFEQTFSVNHQSLKIPGFGKIRETLPAGHLNAEGQSRFLVARVNPSVELVNFNSNPVTTTPPQDGHFFLLTNSQKNQSYVVNITSPELVTQAREQIQNPTAAVGRILIGQVGKNSGGFNRDFNDTKKTPWTWHVDSVLHFAELASQDCDGSPEMIEELALPWIENSGVICFWNYRVTKELRPEDVSH